MHVARALLHLFFLWVWFWVGSGLVDVYILWGYGLIKLWVEYRTVGIGLFWWVIGVCYRDRIRNINQFLVHNLEINKNLLFCYLRQ